MAVPLKSVVLSLGAPVSPFYGPLLGHIVQLDGIASRHGSVAGKGGLPGLGYRPATSGGGQGLPPGKPGGMGAHKRLTKTGKSFRQGPGTY